MADTISPRRRQYVGHWPDRPAAAAAAGPVRPVPDKYAFHATEKRTNKQMHERRTEGHRHRVNTKYNIPGTIQYCVFNVQ